MLIDAGHPAFEDREEAFDGLSVGVTAHPFLTGMINRFVASEPSADRTINVRLIGAQMAGGVGVVENNLGEPRER